jgi:hypothetical protein
MDSSELARELATRYLPTIINQFGCLVLRDPQGKFTASGTVTFIDIDGHKLIVTADHVATRLAAGSGEMALFTLPSYDVLIASPNTAFSEPIFRVDPQDCIILPHGANLDVAAFRASRDVASVPHLRWVEASTQLQAVGFLRSEYQRDGIPFLLFIIGFPNFARVTDPARRIQLFLNFQCWAYLRQVIDTPPILSGNDAPAPQIIFEIELPTEADLPDDAPALIREFTRALHAESAGDREPIGGYSGAPVFYLSPETYYLIGITKEGRNELAGRMFATTINDIILEIRNSHVLG